MKYLLELIEERSHDSTLLMVSSDLTYLTNTLMKHTLYQKVPRSVTRYPKDIEVIPGISKVKTLFDLDVKEGLLNSWEDFLYQDYCSIGHTILSVSKRDALGEVYESIG